MKPPRILQLVAASDRPRLLLFIAAALMAVVVGFLLLSPGTMEFLIVRGGYYYILGTFGCFAYFAWKVILGNGGVWRGGIESDSWKIVVAIGGATLLAVWSDTFEHKVLFDEYVLQGTAWHMHATKEVGTPIRAYDISGTWLAIDAFLDKRPYFFTFLVSLVHDLTGFRTENAFIVNVVLAGATLALTYWLALAVTGRRAPALLAVAGLATLPVFGQNATGASMELHNLAMIAAVMGCAVLYLRQPDEDRLSLLVLGTALLAQCRYESVLFVVPVAFVILLGWLRAGRVQLPWTVVSAPLLFIPYAWLDRYVQSKPILWQLREGETSRFGLGYLAGNLEGARIFFFNLSPGQPNSAWLTLMGCVGLLWVAWRIGPKLRAAPFPAWPPGAIVIGAFGITIAANLGLLMFYYWSRLDELITARFALPLYFILAILAAAAVRSFQARGWPALRIAGGSLLLWLAVCGAPAYARQLYTKLNLVMHETDWEVGEVSSRLGSRLVITSKATMPFLLKRIPALNTSAARARAAQIDWHMRQGTFSEVLVAQVLRPTSADGDIVIDPDDVLPENFQLEPITRKRFGGRWIQLSRLVKVTVASEVSEREQ